MSTLPDHDRVLALLKNAPDKYFATYDIATACDIMDNTVHRALDTLEHKMKIAIDHKPVTTAAGKRVMSYRIGKIDKTFFCGSICACGNSFYIFTEGYKCNCCGLNREDEYKQWAEKQRRKF
jgi:hypothetical protein